MITVLFVIWLFALYFAFEPNIDIVPHKGKYQVYLWYNDITKRRKYRKFIKLFEYEGK